MESQDALSVTFIFRINFDPKLKTLTYVNDPLSTYTYNSKKTGIMQIICSQLLLNLLKSIKITTAIKCLVMKVSCL